MDANTLTQGAIEVAKAAALSIPFTAIVNRVLGPAADEYAEQLRDKRRLYRFEKELAGWKKMAQMISDAGFKPVTVPPKTLFPLLDGVGLEENEDLHTMWAALLANAANPETPDLVHPSFIGILKQLSPTDVAILNKGFEHWESAFKQFSGDQTLSQQLRNVKFSHLDRSPHSQRFLTDSEILSYEVLQRAMLIGGSGPNFVFTLTGYQFVRACRTPARTK